MTQRSNTYLKGISETGDSANQTMFTDFADTLSPFDSTEGALGTFDGALLALDKTGAFTDYTLAANLSITFAESGHLEGRNQWVLITSDGTDTVTFVKPSAYTLLLPDSFTNGGFLAAGIYSFAFAFIAGKIQMKYEPVDAVAAPLPPTMTSATIESASDDVLDFVFNEAVNITTAGWNIDTDGAALSISSVLSGSGTTTPKFQLSRSVLGSETLNVDYNSATGATVSTATAVELVTFTDTAVTNSVGAWTSFNGSTNHLYFDQQLLSVIAGANKTFALEMEMRNWDNSVELQRIFNSFSDEVGLELEIASYIGTDDKFNSNYQGNPATPQGSNNVSTISVPATEMVFRSEYHGTIDTNDGEDRCIMKFDDVVQGVFTNLAVQNFPFDITNKGGNFTVGAGRTPLGVVLSLLYNGEARNFKVYSWNGSSWDLECHVPTLSVGTDISGNNIDGTWV